MRTIRIMVIPFVFVAIPVMLHAQSSDVTFFNPGIKLGYTFGAGEGFTFGVEMSYTYGFKEGGVVGAVLDLDFWKDKLKIHLGVEAVALVGVDIGPTLVFESGARDLGLGITLFTGAVLYPYYSYTLRSEERSDIQELGAYLKLPAQLSGNPWPDF